MSRTPRRGIHHRDVAASRCARRAATVPTSSSCVALSDACLTSIRWGVPTRVSCENEVDGASHHGDESDGGRNLGEEQALASPRLRQRHRDHRLHALLERPRAENRGEGARVACELAAGGASPQVGVEQEALELREVVVQAQRHPATRVLTARVIRRHALFDDSAREELVPAASAQPAWTTRSRDLAASTLRLPRHTTDKLLTASRRA